MTRLRLAFMGTPDFAAVALDALIGAGHEIAAVYCQPARPAGRGQKEQPSAVENLARRQGLAVRTPKRLKSPDEQAAFRDLALDAAVVAAYGLILPREILEAPRLGCFNIHASLLPRWRGAAPIQRAILAGDAASGVTIMQMDAGLDTGAMLAREKVAIGPETTGGALHDALSALGARMMLDVLDRATRGALHPEPQPEEGVTYARKIEKSELAIDWSEPAEAIDRRIRAFAPKPGAFAMLGEERVKILRARLEPVPAAAEPGTVLDDALLVACGEGALRLLTLQRAGRGAMEASDLLRGHPIPAGARFA